jgi:hypothetical protein
MMHSEDRMADEHREQLNEYRRRLVELARLLYEYDPYLMGAAAVPDDEYEPIAVRLMPILSRAVDRSQLVRILEERDIRDPALIEGICRVFSL